MCASIADNSSYLAKTEVLQKFFKKGTKGGKFYLMYNVSEELIFLRRVFHSRLKYIPNLCNFQTQRKFL